MKVLFLFVMTLFIVTSSFRLPLQRDIHSDESNRDKSPRRKITHYLSSLLNKKTQAVGNMLHKIGNSSQGAINHSKRLIMTSPQSVRSFASSLTSALKSKLRKMKEKIKTWLSTSSPDKNTAKQQSHSFKNYFTHSTSGEDVTNSGHEANMPVNFHDDCTEDQRTQIEIILYSLGNMSNPNCDNNSSSQCINSPIDTSSIYQRSMLSGWTLNTDLVQRFVMAAGWRNVYHGRR